MPSTTPTRGHVNRAAQFMPFAALRGYYDLVRQTERVVEPRHEHTPEDIAHISATLSQLARGTVVRVRYYDTDAYVTVTAAVSEVVPAYQTLRLIKTTIHFADIETLEIVE